MSVLVFSPNGRYAKKTSLAVAATAADCIGKTIVVTSPQTVTTAIVWPDDRKLRFEKGGTVSFTGAGSLTNLPITQPDWFGALNDGSTDSTPALEKAVAATKYGGTLYIPVGKWKLSTRLTIDTAINVKGEGKGSILWLDVGAAEVGIVFGNAVTYTNGVVWENFAILGAANSCLVALLLLQVNNSHFNNIHVWAGTPVGGKGVWVRWSLLNHYNFIISGNVAYSPAGAAPYNGFFVSNDAGAATVFNANFIDCMIEGVAGIGLYIVSNADNGNNNIKGTYEGIGGAGIHIKGCKAMTLDNIHSEIAIGATGNEIIIEDCTLTYIGNGVSSFAPTGGYNDVQIINSDYTTIDGLRCNRLSIDANSSNTNIVSIAYVGTSDAGLYDLGEQTINSAGVNSRVAGKAQYICGVYDIVTAANVKGFWIFDATGTTQTVSDRATIGGATGHTVALRDGSLAASNPQNVGVSNLLPYITLDSANVWNTPDSDDFSFGNGATDSPFSVFSLAAPAVSGAVVLVGKDSMVTGATQREWFLLIAADGSVSVYLLDNSAGSYIGRTTPVGALTANILATVGFSYSGSSTAAGIKIYVNGVQVDNADVTSGAYTAMENKTAPVGSYQFSAAGAAVAKFTGKQYAVLIDAEVLTLSQFKRLDILSRSFAGVSL